MALAWLVPRDRLCLMPTAPFLSLLLLAGTAAAAPAPGGAIADGCVPDGIPVTIGQATSADGTRLHYRKLGRGRPAVIYVHGGPGGSLYNGGCELAPLARTGALVLYDQRGGGRSDQVSDPRRLRLADHVADLEAVRRAAGGGRIALIGLSWGAAVATAYADAHAPRVGRLLLLSPMPVAKAPFDAERWAAVEKATGAQTVAHRRALSQQLQKAVRDDELVALCRRLIREAPLPYALDPARHRSPNACDVPAAAIRNRAAVARHGIASLGEWDFRPLLARTKIPVLVVEGAQTVVPLNSTRLWASTPRNGRLLLVPNAGHEVGLDRPDALIAAARRFLGGRWPAGSARAPAR